jgi:heme O synthase-like polyprenyltransferase
MFLIVLSAVLGLIHLYLWKRLIKDTTQPGRTRWLFTAGVVGLPLLSVAALIGPRIVGPSKSGWFAWPR